MFRAWYGRRSSKLKRNSTVSHCTSCALSSPSWFAGSTGLARIAASCRNSCILSRASILGRHLVALPGALPSDDSIPDSSHQKAMGFIYSTHWHCTSYALSSPSWFARSIGLARIAASCRNSCILFRAYFLGRHIVAPPGGALPSDDSIPDSGHQKAMGFIYSTQSHCTSNELSSPS